MSILANLRYYNYMTFKSNCKMLYIKCVYNYNNTVLLLLSILSMFKMHFRSESHRKCFHLFALVHFVSSCVYI